MSSFSSKFIGYEGVDYIIYTTVLISVLCVFNNTLLRPSRIDIHIYFEKAELEKVQSIMHHYWIGSTLSGADIINYCRISTSAIARVLTKKKESEGHVKENELNTMYDDLTDLYRRITQIK